MLATNKKFDSDAIRWANDHNIYCVEMGVRSRKFVSEMGEEEFKELEKINYRKSSCW
jgi:hypothetical protein